MAQLATLLPRVIMQAPALSEPAAEQHLLDSAIEFCRKSYAWQDELDPATLTIDKGEYTLGALGEYRIVKVMQADVAGVALTPMSPDELPPAWQDAPGSPRSYFLRNETTLVVYPVPEAADSLTIRVALAPTHAATTIPDALADQWLDAVIAGALYRACITPGQPYSDPARAAVYQQEFQQQIDRARLAVTKGYGRAPLRVRAQMF